MTQRELSDIEKLVLIYIKQNPRVTGEDIANYFEAGRDDIQKRSQVNNAVEYLVWNGYADRNVVTGAIVKRDVK